MRIERYSAGGELLELSRISRYALDPDPPDSLFQPRGLCRRRRQQQGTPTDRSCPFAVDPACPATSG
ncbi:MAG: hypothetical protein HY900_31315 [Deltaproteobacteria bacterium]|nr:hypothetical protein [Deltaproteobacteria bacterium]